MQMSGETGMSLSSEIGACSRRLPRPVHRKWKRTAQKIQKEFPGTKVFVPDVGDAGCSRHLVLCNYGLMTGASAEDLLGLFGAYGVEDVVLIPARQFAFVSLVSDEAAMKAFQDCNGTPPGSDKPPLAMAFVNQVPPSTSSCSQWCGDLPPGLVLITDFISCEDEEAILAQLDWGTNTADGGGLLKHRQVQHFGYDFIYGSNVIDPSKPNERLFPEAWAKLLKRAVEENIVTELPDQCTVNRYQAGHGIPPHTDSHDCCTETILSLSLGSDIVMNFTPRAAKAAVKKRSVLLKRRSLLVLEGEARYAWSHGITPRATDIIPCEQGLTLHKRSTRTSLTFRKVLKGPCKCSFAQFCESQKEPSVNNELAVSLEATHVHAVYEKIADHFSETRHTPWPKVATFVDSLPQEGGILIDVGCGNGKYLGRNKGQFQIGCDYSRNLASICFKRGISSLRSDCLALPFRDGVADGLICIAVIHHLSTEDRRIQSLEEMCRVLKPGTGRGLIYAWAREQVKDQKKSTYLKQHEDRAQNEGLDSNSCDNEFSLPVHKNRTNFEHADLLVPWSKKQQETYHRYYHVFEEGELESLVGKVAALDIDNQWYDQGNWCVAFKKKAL